MTKKTKRRRALATAAVLVLIIAVAQRVAHADSASSWGLDRIDQRSLPLDGSYIYDKTGSGVTAYIVDSGINSSHLEFSGRIGQGTSFINDGRGTEDCHGHGTHVAGTLGGSSYGVARGVTLVPVRVSDCAGSAWASTIASGVRWATEHHQPGVPAVMNVSVSGPLSNNLNWAIADAVADGIVVVVAAGNNRADACTYSPASATAAITVGGTESNDSRISMSNYGSCVDIFAPGGWVVSSWIGGPSATRTLRGTSFASPHVAGAAALILGVSSTLTPAQVTERLLASATRDVVVDAGAGSPNLLLYVDRQPPVSSTTVAQTTTTTTTIPPIATTTTTTIKPADPQVSASRAGRGYYLVKVTGAPKNTEIGVNALDVSRRPQHSLTWLVTTDGSGGASFFVKAELSRYSLSLVIK
ncbi:MAG: S8 family peptidase [Betaproteobacteria bacterium]|nr:S8 family peptidase [Betaproteobacteria bacterium]NCA23551.1 S8 family peptidase [Betaproteobacteria bacterium]